MRNKIAIVGEAWGREEAQQRMPFVGSSGYILNGMLEDAGINRVDCFVTNVFNLQPEPTNDVINLCVSKKEGGGLYSTPALAKGKYLRVEYLDELRRVAAEIEEVQPNIIIATGNTPSWAFLQDPRISKIRGTISASAHLTGVHIFSRPFKVLPVYHPAAVMRDWSLRHVTVLDLMKAKRESAFPEVVRPQRSIWVEPGLDHLSMFYDRYLRNAEQITFDIETANDQITCIGFAPNPQVALVVPFVDMRKPGYNYWPTFAEERIAWRWVRKVLESPIPKIAQNGLYDVHWLWRKALIGVNNFEHDTMLLHHALQPESPKSLGFLGSVYTNEPAWKLMRGKNMFSMKREG